MAVNILQNRRRMAMSQPHPATATGSMANFTADMALPLKDCVVSFLPKQEGSGDPSPENVRSVTGVSALNIRRTGKNILEPIDASHLDNYQKCTISYANNGVAITSTGNFARAGYVYNIRVGETYTVSFTASGTATYKTIYVSPNIAWSEPVAYKRFFTADGYLTHTFTATSETLFLGFYATSSNDPTGSTLVIEDVQLEIASDATGFQPYSGTVYPIAFPSSAGTVYGGSLDVSAGVLTVEWANIASYAGETIPGVWISDRDVYASGTTPTTGAQVAYQLAEPITYTLTPQQITTIIGTNNIWSDAGNIELTYWTH